ncbi:MAG: glycoprotein endo-alpha,2-mannosidase [Gaiellaceae bacterium]|nr:glycoprotein endo-alpha,2-mannosidase [Gaiellaceae bacterium]
MRRLLLALLLLLAMPATAAGQAAPRTAIFFYPWYSNPRHDGQYVHWEQGGHSPPFDVASAFFPLRGAYSSGNPRVLDAQMADIAASGIDEVVSSWWGRGSAEDRRLSAVMGAAKRRGLQVAVQLEPYAGRTIDSIAADLAYIRGLGINDVYIYRSNDFPAADWNRITRQPTGLRLFGQTNLVGFAARAGFAGFYTYDIVIYHAAKFDRYCRQARAAGILCAPSVGPGYDALAATGDTNIKERLDGVTYDSMWKAAIRAGADVVTVTSYNEWGEGTQIEPAGRGGRYENYDGAYGMHGRAAQRAYIKRTAYWTSRF